MKTDYSEEIRNLIDRNYEPVESLMQNDGDTVKKTLSRLHKELTNILPERWVEESDVYDALVELGFQSFLYPVPAVYNDDGELVTEEYEVLCWLLKKKTAAI